MDSLNPMEYEIFKVSERKLDGSGSPKTHYAIGFFGTRNSIGVYDTEELFIRQIAHLINLKSSKYGASWKNFLYRTKRKIFR